MTLEEKETKECVVGIDLGGTKIAFATILIDPKDKKPIIFQNSIPTFDNNAAANSEDQREAFLDRLAENVHQIVEKTKEAGYSVLPKIGMGSPGNILRGVIKAGTTPQLGPAFDNFSIEKGLAKSFKKFWKVDDLQVVVKNDALAQMAFSIFELAKDKKNVERLDGNRLCYIGPGTGLGGGFAWLTTENELPKLDFFTDGHIGDIIVGHDEGGNPLWAEFEYISGLFIAKRTSGLTGVDLANDIEKHRPLIEEMGANLGKIIEMIHLGNIYKARATTFWTDQDRESVKGINYFIIGGSIGSKGEMGKIIRKMAQNYLASHLKDSEIELIPIPTDSANAGILGAANFVLS